MPIKISEAQFADTIEETLDLFGWRWIHSRPAMVTLHGQDTWRTALSGTEGFPDYLVTRDGKTIVFELKSDDGELSADQYFWLCALQESGIDCYLWQPKDDFNKIVDILSPIPSK